MAKKTTKNESPSEAKTTKKTAAKKSGAKASGTSKKRTTKSRVARDIEVVSKPKPKKKLPKGYSKKELAEFKKIIVEKREEIINTLNNLKEQMMDSSGQYVNENSPYSLHMAEQGTDAMEREKLYLWAQRETKFLGYLEEALARIDAGTYGLCIECIEEPQHLCPTCPLVPKERLLAVPHTQHCLQIKQKMQNKK